MAAKSLLVIILLIFLVTILNWLRLGQFLTVSPQISPDEENEEKNELQQRREDQMFVESSKDSNGEGGLGKKQVGKVEEVGLLDWLRKQQQRKASLAAACARDTRWKLFKFLFLIISNLPKRQTVLIF